ncbi:MAG: hypothetical protein K9J06_00395 [Flavobacteriales bacterium]|nr:hypothetical protein [Flavobacteriales bacterium]
MQSCKKATELMELREEGQLGTFQCMGLRLHTMMCSACRQYELQRELLAKAMTRQIDAPATEEKADALKARIREALKED